MHKHIRPRFWKEATVLLGWTWSPPLYSSLSKSHEVFTGTSHCFFSIVVTLHMKSLHNTFATMLWSWVHWLLKTFLHAKGRLHTLYLLLCILLPAFLTWGHITNLRCSSTKTFRLTPGLLTQCCVHNSLCHTSSTNELSVVLLVMWYVQYIHVHVVCKTQSCLHIVHVPAMGCYI